MALGAIYSGQILFEVTKCCLRRLRSISTGEACNEDGALAMSEDEDSTLGGGAMRRSASSRSGSATNEGTTSMSSSSGSASSAGAMRLRSSIQSGSATRAGATRQASSSRSGLSMDSSSSGGGMRSISSGSATRSGCSSASGDLAISSGSATRSGCSSASGDPAISSGSTTRSGISSAHVAGNPATLVDNVVSVESEWDALSSSSVGKVNCNKGPKGSLNPWNNFQHEHRGKGLSSTALSKMYKGRKETL